MTGPPKEPNPPPGVYDTVIDAALQALIAESEQSASQTSVDSAEAADRYARLVADAVRRAIGGLRSEDRTVEGARIVNEVIRLLDERVERANLEDDQIVDPPRVLEQVALFDPSGKPILRSVPQSPLSGTSLLTNAPNEPNLVSELRSEIDSADEIEILGAFIRFSGIRQLLHPLQEVIRRGGRVRVMTTTYTGTTEKRALDELTAIGAEVRVSYDRTATRLHAKAWLFKRRSGFTTAYIGSSNLTHQAQVTGLEWNVRASMITTPEVIEKFSATFDTYWAESSFVPYKQEEFEREIGHANAKSSGGDFEVLMVDVAPFAFQEALLQQMAYERSQGRNRNLIVAATGTGKTFMAAFDYRRLQDELPNKRLLFVAHRKEILRQSRHTFRTALRDGTFGELWVDGQKPEKWQAVFASIQSLNAGDIKKLTPDHWDMVIVDEFHHAAAKSYAELLDYVQPNYLLGLTATPERADGQDITRYFGGHVAAELRLWDALEQGRLVPFHYFGIADGADLSNVDWSSGRYDARQLENVYTADDVWVSKVLQAVADKVTDPRRMRALGFCTTVAHAEFMAAKFNDAGLQAVSVTGGTASEARKAALSDLQAGNIQAIFAVDVFNEGVDIPAVDTVLFLRPTESSTVYLQQLGRGLRQFEGKEVLTVLDFVGQHRKEFRFDMRFRKMLGHNRAQVEAAVKDDFPFLPAGCDIQLDTVAKQLVLDNIKNSLPTTWRARKAESQAIGAVSLRDFLEATGLELAELYAQSHSYTELLRVTGQLTGEATDAEKQLGRALTRMLHIDDPLRLGFFHTLLSQPTPPDPSSMNHRELRLLHMLHYTLWGVSSAKPLKTGLGELWQEEAIMTELRDLLYMLQEQLHQARPETELENHIPLRIGGHYARDEAVAAFGVGSPAKPPQVREGVKWVEEEQTNMLFVTLNKSESDYSPSTMYKDYALSADLFHWQTQSTTSAASPTGTRYITQPTNGTNVALLVRSTRKDAYGRTSPYQFLGLADYVSHEGDRPMSITWRLRSPMPAASLMQFRAAVA